VPAKSAVRACVPAKREREQRERGASKERGSTHRGVDVRRRFFGRIAQHRYDTEDEGGKGGTNKGHNDIEGEREEGRLGREGDTPRESGRKEGYYRAGGR
jgi:hypothetical protein